MLSKEKVNDNNRDDYVDDNLSVYTKLNNLQSFFLFAGAGSGKTRSLEKVLQQIIIEQSHTLIIENRKIAVITYTNAASEEILSRVNYHPLIHISTIHSFIWDLIKPYQVDIRKNMVENAKINNMELKDLIEGKSKTTKIYRERIKKIGKNNERIEKIREDTLIGYSLSGDKSGYNYLNHNEVIKIGAQFISENTTFQHIIVNKFPILLIDESQDTNKELMESFLILENEYKNKFCLGLIGDTTQRIYQDGKINLKSSIPIWWKRENKVMNHRSQKRIVTLINEIGKKVDSQQQESRSDKDGGQVCFFICSTDNAISTEREIAKTMENITGDPGWLIENNEFQKLTLEHNMVAKRLGFFELIEPLYKEYRDQVYARDREIPGMSLFSKDILPILNFHRENNKFAIMNHVANRSPILNINYETDEFKDCSVEERLRLVKNGIDTLLKIWENNSNPTCLEILKEVKNSKLFNIPSVFDKVLLENDSEESELTNWEHALLASFNQVERYIAYKNNDTDYMTHQGVKGLEYERVMVIVDDEEAKGFMFSYDKLFGIKEKSKTDIDNEKEGKETSIERTTRLLYVISSRAKESLAIVYHVPNTIEKKALYVLKDNLIKNNWFNDEEIRIINIE